VLDFVRAAAHIRSSGRHASFVVFGAAGFSDAAYERGIRAQPESAHVEFLGWRDDVGGALRELDILAVPSAGNEALGRVILEAFSAGTPVVAYRSGGIPEIVDDGRTGLLTQANDCHALAASIDFLIGQPERRRKLALAAREDWQRRFTVERFGNAVCEVIEAAAHQESRSTLPISEGAVRT
jgi:glycosyltransferase involved in cell wall biosynthesis